MQIGYRDARCGGVIRQGWQKRRKKKKEKVGDLLRAQEKQGGLELGSQKK